MNLNSAIEKDDRLLEQKHTGSQYDKNQNWATNIIKPMQTRIYRKKYVIAL